MHIKQALFVVIVLATLFGWQSPAQAANEVTCAPNSPVKENNTFTLTAGEAVVFTCTVKNDAGTPLAVTLVAKQVGSASEIQASAMDMNIDGGATAEAALRFPVLFKQNTYQFTFSLVDAKTKDVLSEGVAFTGVVEEGALVHIVAATLDTGQHAWSAPLTLALTTAQESEKNFEDNALTLDVFVLDQEGQPCRTVASGQAVTAVQSEFRLTLPEQGVCVSTLNLVLKNKGVMVDQKTLAVDFSKKVAVKNGAVPSTPLGVRMNLPIIFIALALTGVLLLGLAGYFAILYRKRR